MFLSADINMSWVSLSKSCFFQIIFDQNSKRENVSKELIMKTGPSNLKYKIADLCNTNT